MRPCSSSAVAAVAALLIVASSCGAAPGQQAILSNEYEVEYDEFNLDASPDALPFHDNYHSLPEIAQFTAELSRRYPDRVQRIPLGHTAEGREMEALHISADSGMLEDGDGFKKKKEKKKKKRSFVITGAQHAREWIATASALHLAHALTSPSNASSGGLSHLLESFDFHIIPVPNPDGYAFTWEPEGERLWYKNRMPLGPGEQCTGLDLNRNWGYEWSPSSEFVEGDPLYSASFPLSDDDIAFFDDLANGYSDSASSSLNSETHETIDASKKKPIPAPIPAPADPCSHWYPGRRPFEAPEVNNMANYIMLVPRLEAFLDLRAYGQMVSIPFAYTCSAYPRHAENLFEAAIGMASAAARAARTLGSPITYKVARLCESLYPAPGGMLDWMYGAARAKHAFAVHLRDTGTFGYALPAEKIHVVGREVGAMVRSLADFIENGGEQRW